MSTAATTDADILIVEDHGDTQAALLHLLTQQGFSVLTADNGQQALDLLEGGLRPRLILLDLMLPRVSGADLLTQLHADQVLRQVPVIVITAAPRERVQHLVADAVLHKPLDYERLVTAIRGVIAKHG
jgi:CheY-like chemotaxis protein